MDEKPSHLQIYLLHRTALVDYAAPIVGCRARAEDVVQEAYIRFSQSAGKDAGADGGIARPVGYLYRIVRNLAIDLARRLATEVPDTAPEAIARLVADAPSAEQTVLYRDELRVLAEALADLPERTRIAFDMHRLQGKTLQQVAEHLGVSTVRAHQLVRDAVLHAARRLDAEDEDEDTDNEGRA